MVKTVSIRWCATRHCSFIAASRWQRVLVPSSPGVVAFSARVKRCEDRAVNLHLRLLQSYLISKEMLI